MKAESIRPPSRFLASVSPLRALLGAYALGAFSLLILLSLRAELVSVVVQQGLFFISAGIAVWSALRLRSPTGPWWRRALSEIVAGLIASAPSAIFEVLFRVQLVTADWLGRLLLARRRDRLFVLSRGRRCLAFFWDRLRHRRLIWSFTRFSTVVVVALLVVVVLTLPP
ncbi:MAG: hypothetical protein U0559_08015 [Anaerolineae bacterium]